MKKPLIILYLYYLICHSASGQSLLDKTITVSFQDTFLIDILNQLKQNEGINFAYSDDIIPKEKISISKQDATLHQVLNELFQDKEIKFIVYAGQVILQKAPPKPKKFSLNGSILDRETQQPIPYSTVERKNTGEGSVADHEGRFSLEIQREDAKDTLIFSSMGYEKLEIRGSSLAENGYHKIYLQPKTIQLKPIEIHPDLYKIKKIGNQGNLVRGSIYIDTHGQQTALFMENDKELIGQIMQVQFFLSRKGNTEAPIRIRVYQCDTVGKPGKDLLPHMIVVKPDQKSGWFSVDLSEFEIDIPEKGFFVAIQGVYPNDFENYIHSSGFDNFSVEKFEKDGDDDPDFISESVSYGQRLGYCRKRQNNTWHYSLSRTWFQLKKRHYSAMIGAVVEVQKEKRIKK